MTILGRLAERIEAGAGAVGGFFERLVAAVRQAQDPATRRQFAFSVAMIALSAKMAKADGVVTHDEINAFRDLVSIPAGEEANVARLFNLAKQDVAGFDSYAARISGLFPDDPDILEDILDGLYHIAKADGIVHEREDGYIDRVAEIFGFSQDKRAQIRARHVMPEEGDPYQILGVSPVLDDAELKRHYRKLVSENHPDRLIARGVPPEFVKIASDKLAAINAAWDRIEAERAL